MLYSCNNQEIRKDPITSIFEHINFEMYQEMPPLPARSGVKVKKGTIKNNN